MTNIQGTVGQLLLEIRYFKQKFNVKWRAAQLSDRTEYF
jgi:hypothetical protein